MELRPEFWLAAARLLSLPAACAFVWLPASPWHEPVKQFCVSLPMVKKRPLFCASATVANTMSATSAAIINITINLFTSCTLPSLLFRGISGERPHLPCTVLIEHNSDSHGGARQPSSLHSLTFFTQA